MVGDHAKDFRFAASYLEIKVDERAPFDQFQGFCQRENAFALSQINLAELYQGYLAGESLSCRGNVRQIIGMEQYEAIFTGSDINFDHVNVELKRHQQGCPCIGDSVLSSPRMSDAEKIFGPSRCWIVTRQRRAGWKTKICSESCPVHTLC